MDKLEKKRIATYLQGGNIEDDSLLGEAFSNPANDHELTEIAFELWNDLEYDHIDLNHVLNRIHTQIDKKRRMEWKNRLLSTYYKFAAILIIPLIIAGGLLTNHIYSQPETFTEIVSPKGSRIQFILPDGTYGNLNGGSALSFSSNYIKKRNIKIEGEGYFKVVKDEKHPFTVETQMANVRVLGTRFDVCAYDTDGEIITTLEEGSVKVINKKNDLQMVLEPGQQNRINTSTGKMDTQKVNTKLYTSWKDELLRFDNAPFSEVLRKMERWYGVKIEVDNEQLYNEFYTMTIRTESLKEMLELLALTTPIVFKIEVDRVYISNKNKINGKLKN
jgi:ferric-dicitrate binding protein FerR (iron transport regulator)